MCGERPEQLLTPLTRTVRDVWVWNFQREFDEFQRAAANAGPGSIVALDTEFPGFLYQESKTAAWAMRYQALRANVEMLRPIQIGFAIADALGVVLGVWSFNLLFNLATDWHTDEAMSFLTSAGVDLPRHANEGIDPHFFGRRLCRSTMIRNDPLRRLWVTFSGSYDLAYLLKILTGRHLPQRPVAFEAALETFCPARFELQDTFPMGSLESLVRMHGIQRCGLAHTAGSDALATLDLYMRVVTSRMASSSSKADVYGHFFSGDASVASSPKAHTTLTPTKLRPPKRDFFSSVASSTSSESGAAARVVPTPAHCSPATNEQLAEITQALKTNSQRVDPLPSPTVKVTAPAKGAAPSDEMSSPASLRQRQQDLTVKCTKSVNAPSPAEEPMRENWAKAVARGAATYCTNVVVAVRLGCPPRRTNGQGKADADPTMMHQSDQNHRGLPSLQKLRTSIVFPSARTFDVIMMIIFILGFNCVSVLINSVMDRDGLNNNLVSKQSEWPPLMEVTQTVAPRLVSL